MLTTIPKRYRPGFTIVELLVVIAIMGILAGLITSAVFGALLSARRGAYKMQTNTLNEAVENYRNKYGDYPPDGSSWAIMERHLRKAFPQILQSELDLLAPVAIGASGTLQIHNHFIAGTGFVMDPAEALVFFLGGFSADPQRPFTGNGGPFLITPHATNPTFVHYNTRRTNPFFEFVQARLTIRSIDNPNTSPATPAFVSDDDGTFFNIANDILPVYLSDTGGVLRSAPFVYFDSRTYVFDPLSDGSAYVNFYQRTSVGASPASDPYGAIRPLVSRQPRQRTGAPPSPLTALWWLKSNEFVNDKTFQIIGPGLDNVYGGRLGQEVNLASTKDRCESLLVYARGDSYSPPGVPGVSSNMVYARWKLNQALSSDPLFKRSQGTEDNTANFSDTTFLTSTDE